MIGKSVWGVIAAAALVATVTTGCSQKPKATSHIPNMKPAMSPKTPGPLVTFAAGDGCGSQAVTRTAPPGNKAEVLVTFVPGECDRTVTFVNDYKADRIDKDYIMQSTLVVTYYG